MGATLQENGANLALYPQNATAVLLLLFDRPDGPPTDAIQLPDHTRFVSHAFVPEVRAGQLCGYKLRGPFDLGHGLRFTAHKLLLSPYVQRTFKRLSASSRRSLEVGSARRIG